MPQKNMPMQAEPAINLLVKTLDKTSQSYKFFFMRALLHFAVQEKKSATLREVADFMIKDAQALAGKYHLSLGPGDVMGKLALGEAPRGESYEKQLNRLMRNVPYRFLSPFLPEFREDVEWRLSPGKLADKINTHRGLPYYFDDGRGLMRRIYFDEAWQIILRENLPLLADAVDEGLETYLKRHNPSITAHLAPLLLAKESLLFMPGFLLLSPPLLELLSHGA